MSGNTLLTCGCFQSPDVIRPKGTVCFLQPFKSRQGNSELLVVITIVTWQIHRPGRHHPWHPSRETVGVVWISRGMGETIISKQGDQLGQVPPTSKAQIQSRPANHAECLIWFTSWGTGTQNLYRHRLGNTLNNPWSQSNPRYSEKHRVAGPTQPPGDTPPSRTGPQHSGAE